MKNVKDISNTILDQIFKKNRVIRTIFASIGCLIVAIIYNCFIVPNNLVTGGVGGIAILVSKFTNISPIIFIDCVSILLLVVSYIIIGRRNTFHALFGFVMYAIMASLTEPLAKYIYFSFDSFLFSTIIASIISGIGYGLVYKTGFNTGGMDSLIAIIQKYVNIPNTRLSTILNTAVILFSVFIFGISKTIYAVIYLKIVNVIADIIILGNKTRKICFIKSKKIEDIKKYIIDELEIGLTEIDKDLVMCVVPIDRFYTLKKDIHNIDKNIFLVTNDCYTVEGGSINPLIELKDL